MPELEKVIERKLRDGVKKLGGGAQCLKFESPGTSGVPDRMILLPGGRVVFVELKQVGKRERMRQTYVQNQMRRLGFTVFSTVSTPEQVQTILSHAARWIVKSSTPTPISSFASSTSSITLPLGFSWIWAWEKP